MIAIMISRNKRVRKQQDIMKSNIQKLFHQLKGGKKIIRHQWAIILELFMVEMWMKKTVKGCCN
jgi:hypothetical protein